MGGGNEKIGGKGSSFNFNLFNVFCREGVFFSRLTYLLIKMSWAGKFQPGTKNIFPLCNFYHDVEKGVIVLSCCMYMLGSVAENSHWANFIATTCCGRLIVSHDAMRLKILENSHYALCHPSFHPKRIVDVWKHLRRLLANVSQIQDTQNMLWLFRNIYNAFWRMFPKYKMPRTYCGCLETATICLKPYDQFTELIVAWRWATISFVDKITVALNP